MKKYIRMDDYPHGMPNYGSDYQNTIKNWVKIFEKYKINYILGVTPLLLKEHDFIFLDENINCGRIVMHGFTHKFDHKGPWNTIVNTWKFGGEFMGLSEDTIEEKYNLSDSILKKFKSYDPEHFVPPFNCITQSLLNVLNKKNIKYLHTCDKEYDEYGYKNLNFGNILPIISKYHVGYDDAHKVLSRINEDLGQITLHWIFDQKYQNWLLDYEKLSIILSQKKEYSN